ncbi:MAG TPA: LysM peptidoglycan-binding domain-containing protein [Bacillota bacterium]|nr:LysM peptidoglycan-binding domain-containing protein [Bacillota bacterium]
MAIILNKLKGKTIHRKSTTSDWDRLFNLLKILVILFLVFSCFHWIIKKKVQNLPVTPSLAQIGTQTKLDSITSYNKIYTVRSGDTLWSIASSQYPRQNTVNIIKEIKKLNQLTKESLKPGQPLKLP